MRKRGRRQKDKGRRKRNDTPYCHPEGRERRKGAGAGHSGSHCGQDK